MAILVIGAGLLAGFVIVLAALASSSRPRRGTATHADGSVAWMGDSGSDCGSGADGGCDGGGGDGGGGGGGD